MILKAGFCWRSCSSLLFHPGHFFPRSPCSACSWVAFRYRTPPFMGDILGSDLQVPLTGCVTVTQLHHLSDLPSLFISFWRQGVLCRPGWPWTHSVAEHDLDFLIFQLHLRSAGITHMHHCTRFVGFWVPKQALCPWSCFPVVFEMRPHSVA